MKRKFLGVREANKTTEAPEKSTYGRYGSFRAAIARLARPSNQCRMDLKLIMAAMYCRRERDNEREPEKNNEKNIVKFFQASTIDFEKKY